MIGSIDNSFRRFAVVRPRLIAISTKTDQTTHPNIDLFFETGWESAKEGGQDEGVNVDGHGEWGCGGMKVPMNR